MASTSDPQVVVVGAGPAGLVTSIVLARHGIQVLLVDKRAERSALTRALAISVRSMEIFRAWGLEDEVLAGAIDVVFRAWLSPTLGSAAGSAMSLGYPTGAEASRVSPTRPAWAPQHHLEAVLDAELGRRPEIDLRRGHRVTGLRHEDGRVVVEAVLEGTGEVVPLDADYVVAADGAHSVVRGSLGLVLTGPDFLGEYHRVEFRAPLGRYVGPTPSALHIATQAAAVLAAHGRDDVWGLVREWRPGEPRLVDAEPEQVVAQVRAAVGDDSLDVELRSSNAFVFAAQLADDFRRSRGFLTGDAAHRVTPRGGTGMNMAIQDGFDLGWKLAWVLHGWAGPALLDTYGTERRPVAAHNVARSARPDGAQAGAPDALAWDLAGRVPHHWVDEERGVSTLDLVGPGLTRLLGPVAPLGGDLPIGVSAPVVEHRLDGAAATAVGLAPDGIALLRPDAKVWDPPAVDETHPPAWPLP